jgi:hypothetical protein
VATPAGNDAVRVTGQLYHTPTGADLTVVANRGTPLGLVDRIIFSPGFITKALIREETNRVHKLLYCGQRPRLAFSLESFDPDALAVIFGNVMSTGLKGPRLKAGDSMSEGTAISPKVILFAPEKAAHPGLILYAALPLLEETDEARFTAVNPLTFSALFECEENASGWVYQMNRLSFLELAPA